MHRISRKVVRDTPFVEHIAGPAVPVSFRQPLNAERLVKLDLPELPVAAESRRELELYNEQLDVWERRRIDRFAVDGRACLERLDGEFWVRMSGEICRVSVIVGWSLQWFLR